MIVTLIGGVIGAVLLLQTPVKTFDFVLPERCHHTCRVVWANGGRMGVQFQ